MSWLRISIIPAYVRTVNYLVFTLIGLDGFGYCEVKPRLDLDLAMLEWTLAGQLTFRFGLRSSPGLLTMHLLYVLPLVLMKLCCADGTSELDDAI